MNKALNGKGLEKDEIIRLLSIEEEGLIESLYSEDIVDSNSSHFFCWNKNNKHHNEDSKKYSEGLGFFIK